MRSKILEEFLHGQSIKAYKYFGAHFVKRNDVEGIIFRVYAPLAKEVSIIGDFNNYNPSSHIMKKVDYAGVFELFIPNLSNYVSYKYHILNCQNVYVDKADPFATFSCLRPLSDSRTFNIENFIWHDKDYLRKRTLNYNKPMSIYEMHLGSWVKKLNDENLSYEELADILIPYIKEQGYTTVEMMPIMQYPCDASWGYQTTGFFSVDSRYGNPFQLMSLIDRLHQANIGVILDYVLVHFAIDDFSLSRFDGSCVYEYDDSNEYSQWGSKLFNLGKDPVRSFLMSGANYFLEYFHFDGLRFDAISNVIYWGGDSTRGVNQGAIEFIKRMTSKLHKAHKKCMLIAEDSSSYEGVTKPVSENGLGFDYKWDLGWMNDTLKYYEVDPIYRKYDHNKLTFSMAYFYSEKFMLPLSHDEVVHGKKTIVNKIFGNYDAKFAQARNLYTYQFAHPGKKLNFMGNELGTFDEWNENKELYWDIKKYPKHLGMSRMLRDLNLIYQHEEAMYKEEYNPLTFRWLIVDNNTQSIYAFMRKYKNNTLVFIFNMTPLFYDRYDIGVEEEGIYEEIFNSDKDIYGGLNQYNGLPLKTEECICYSNPFKLTIKLASYGAIILKKRK